MMSISKQLAEPGLILQIIPEGWRERGKWTVDLMEIRLRE